MLSWAYYTQVWSSYKSSPRNLLRLTLLDGSIKLFILFYVNQLHQNIMSSEIILFNFYYIKFFCVPSRLTFWNISI